MSEIKVAAHRFITNERFYLDPDTWEMMPEGWEDDERILSVRVHRSCEEGCRYCRDEDIYRVEVEIMRQEESEEWPAGVCSPIEEQEQ